MHQPARLAQIGIEIEDRGAPQDIEWANADGQLWVLQARPITHLPPAPLGDVRWEPPLPGSAWWRRQVVENNTRSRSRRSSTSCTCAKVSRSQAPTLTVLPMDVLSGGGLRRPAALYSHQRLRLHAS